MNIEQNFGVIEPIIKQSDYVAGEISGIEYEESNPSGQWDNYLPSIEVQKGKLIDPMSCVSYSACNAIETLIKFKTGVSENFSDRFVAKMSETTPQGNRLDKVADTIRHYGLIDEEDWSYNQNEFTWDKYYESIPSDVVKKGIDFLRRYEIMYEWLYLPMGENTGVPKDMLIKHLKQAPIQITVKTCSPWHTNDVIQNCGSVQSNHAILLTGYEEGKYWKIFDTYNPNNKKLAWDYYIPWALKYTINKKSNPLLAKYEGKYIMRVEGSGEIYKVENGELKFLNPYKQEDGHTPLFDEWVKKMSLLGLLIGVKEDYFKTLN